MNLKVINDFLKFDIKDDFNSIKDVYNNLIDIFVKRLLDFIFWKYIIWILLILVFFFFMFLFIFKIYILDIFISILIGFYLGRVFENSIIKN